MFCEFFCECACVWCVLCVAWVCVFSVWCMCTCVCSVFVCVEFVCVCGVCVCGVCVVVCLCGVPAYESSELCVMYATSIM